MRTIRWLATAFFLSPAALVLAQETTAPETWSLEACIRYALEHSITVRQATLTQTSSGLNYAQSKFERYPSLTANASQSLTNGRSIDPITSDFVSQTVHSTSMSLNAQVTLYNGNKLNNQVRQNGLLAEQSALYTEEAKNSIVLSVTEAYLRVQYYSEGIRAAENTVDGSRRQLAQGQARLTAGSASAKDVADLQSQLAQNEYTLLSARNQYAQQVLALKQLLELEPGQPFAPENPETEQPVALIPEKQAVYEAALENMPEIRAANLQQQIRSIDVDIAKAGYLPSLSLSGALSTGYTNTQNYDFGSQLNTNFNQRLMLSLSVPVFARYQTKTNVRNAEIGVEAAQLTAQSEQKELYKKIETAWENATAARGELQSAQAVLDASKIAYDLAQEQFSRGALDPVSLAVSQNTWLNARQSYLQAKYMHILYTELLQFYQGNPIKL